MSEDETVEQRGGRHVHFDVKTTAGEADTRNVTYTRSGDEIVVLLGFLKIYNRYIIDLQVPWSLCQDLIKDLKQFQPDFSKTNQHCHLIELLAVKHEPQSYYAMKIELFAYKEKLLREQLHIVNVKDDKEVLKLSLTARVLGKVMGSAPPRKGVNSVGVEEPPQPVPVTLDQDDDISGT